jgi:hypothetical protein
MILLRRLLHGLQALWYQYVFFAFLAGRRRIAPVRSEWEAQPAAGARRARYLVLFAHYDAGGQVLGYVHEYLRQLRLLDADIVFVSTAERLDEPALARLRESCCRVIVRENSGYDFGSWKTALQRGPSPEGYEALVITNDSVFGPARDLRPIVERMMAEPCDFWGITDSYELFYHLQSYFVCFKPAVFRSPAFARFWERYPFTHHKRFAIWNGEVRLTQALKRAGFTPGAACPYAGIRVALEGRSTRELAFTVYALLNYHRGGHPNPTHFFWDSLLLRNDMPFLKKELVLDNPMRVKNLGEIPAVLKAVGPYPYELVAEALRRRAASG